MANNISLGVIIGAALSGSFGNAFRTATSSANSLGRSLQNVRMGRTAIDNVNRLNQELATLRARQASVGTGDQELNRQIAETRRQLDRARSSAERYGVNLRDLTNENNRLTSSEQRLGAQLARTNTLRRNTERRSQIGSSMMGTAGLGIAAGFAVAAPIKETIEFESVMADVRKVVDMTDDELKTLGKSILAMSKTMPMAAGGIGAVVAAAGQSGIAKNELLSFTEAAVKMGVAFDMTGEEAGQMMASFRAGMAISQPEVEALADAINYLDTNMNASAKNISDVVQRQGAVAKAAGLSGIQTAALSAALLNSGARSEIAATALKNMTNALTRGSSATKSQMKVFEQLGMTSQSVTSGMQKDAEGTIKNVFAALAKMPAEMRGAMVGDLFGEEAKGAIMPLLVNIKALSQAFDTVGDATKFAGSMQKEYEIRSKTTANNAQLLSNKFDALKISVGSALLPALNEVFGVIGNVSTKIGGMAEKFPQVTQAIVGVTFGLIGLKLGALAVMYTTTLFSTAWTIATGAMAFFTNGLLGTRIGLIALNVQTFIAGAAQKAMAVWTGTVTAAQWLWNAALSANPIGLVIVGITAFGALAYTVYKNWQPIMAWFKENFAWLGSAVDKVKGYANTVGNAVSSFGKFMTTPVIGTGAGTKGSLSSFAATPATATLPNIAAANKTTAGNKTVNATIHVTQKPGEDGEALANRVVKKINAQAAADKRGALHD